MENHMKKTLLTLIILPFALAACGTNAPASNMPGESPIPALVSTNQATPPEGNVQQSGTASGTSGQGGQTGTGTGLDRTLSPAELATSQAVFERANRTGPDADASQETTPAADQTPGPEQHAPNRPNSNDNPCP